MMRDVNGARTGRRIGVRARSAAAAATTLAFVLVLASLALLVVLRESVVNAAIMTATSRAQDVAGAIESEGAISAEVNLEPGSAGESAVRVLSGPTVVAGPPGFTSLAEPFVEVSAPVLGVSAADHVVVRQSWAEGRETVIDAAEALAVGVPLLVLVVAAATYVLTGRALRPVEDMRRRTEQISAEDLTTRVADPRTGDEVDRLARTLNAMLDRLQASYEAQDRFVADASHELRSPITAVRAEIAVARLVRDNDWGRTFAVIDGETARMQSLVEDLLLLGGSGQIPADARRTDVDLDEVVEAVGFALRPPAGVTVSVDTLPGRVRGDREALRRAVQNLAENAMRHAGSRVALATSTDLPDGRWVAVTVDDDGPGIAAEDRERVFERFVRLDAARARSTGGFGLGLAIVREIATTHRGTVTASISPLGGARFELRIPAG